MVAAFVERELVHPLGRWFCDYAQSECSFIEWLLTSDGDVSQQSRTVLLQLIETCRDIPIARHRDVKDAVSAIVKTEEVPSLVDACMRSALIEYSTGTLSLQDCLAAR